MYRCKECGKRFTRPRKIHEHHGHGVDFVETLFGCAFCGSGSFYEIPERYCKSCGREFFGYGGYCSRGCAEEGEHLYEKEREYRLRFSESAVAQAVREVNEYNKAHGTDYSYGKYFSLKSGGKL